MGVFTHISKENLNTFLEDYNLKEVQSFEGINEGIQNTNYKIKIDSKDFILTIYENINRIDDLDFFLSLMNYLSSKGIKCPIPIENSKSNYVGEIKSKPAALLTFLDGKSTLNIKKDHTFEVGKVLAEMHLNTKDFPLEKINDLSVDGWEKLLIKNKNKIDKFEKNLYKKIEDKIIIIRKKWPKDLPSGVIHADLFPDNVLFRDGKVSGLIDFYFSCNDYFVYDLCICINAWCFNYKNEFQIDLFQNLLKGYQSIRKLEEEEINVIPLLCHASSLRFLLTRIDNWKNKNDLDIVNYQDPMEFLKRLEFHELNKNLGNFNLNE
tara:strand:+ start:91 stop:1056 length:966 start_codon:yes stop_codon:yes gene_type:complete